MQGETRGWPCRMPATHEGNACAAMVFFPRERFTMPSPAPRRRARGPFPSRYESMRIEGKEHPADAVIDKLPAIVRARRRLLRLSEEALRSATNQASLRA